MAASHFFVGLGAGIAIISVPVLLFTPATAVPQRIADWIAGPQSAPTLQISTEDAAATRPLRGYRPGDPTPAAPPVPTLQPKTVPTPVPPRQTGAVGQVAPNVSLAAPTANIRWAGTGVIRSGGVPVTVRRIAGVDSGDDPQIADGSPVLVAAGPPLDVAGQPWRAIRGLNGLVGWVPSSQLAVDGEASLAPVIVSAAPTPIPSPVALANRGTIGNTDGVGVVLRNSPNEADRTRSGLMDGTAVTLLEYAGSDWVRVRADNGQTGWVPARYVNAG